MLSAALPWGQHGVLNTPAKFLPSSSPRSPKSSIHNPLPYGNLRFFGVYLDCRKSVFGSMLAYLGPSWPYVGLSWPILAPCWPILGLLTSIFAHLGPTWLQHGPNLAQHGPTWTQLGPTWLSNPRFLVDFEGHVGSQNRQKINIYRKCEKCENLLLA